LALFCLIMWLWTSPGWRLTFATLRQHYRKLTPMGRFIAIALLAVFLVKGSTKSISQGFSPPTPPPTQQQSPIPPAPDPLPTTPPPPPLRLSTNQYRAGFALTSVTTNAATWAERPANAVIYERWTRYGVANDLFWLPCTPGTTNSPNGRLSLDWGYTLGTNQIEGIYIATTGTLSFNRPKGSPTAREMPDPYGISFMAPLQTHIGIVPPAGQFWHAITVTNTLLCTWQNVYYGRLAEYPISFQIELWPHGDFVYRYDFSALHDNQLFRDHSPPTTNHYPLTTNFVIGAQHNHGGETFTLGDTNAVVHGLNLHWRAFGLLDPAIDDHDGDGLSTYDEVMIYGTDPNRTDTDGDGLSDYDEIFVYGTDPNNPDSRGIGVPDCYGVAGYDLSDTNLPFRLANGIAPDVDLSLDSDGDGWPDWLEELFGTDPMNSLDNPKGKNSHFSLTVSLSASPSMPGILAIGDRRVLVTGAGVWQFWLPAGVMHSIFFTAKDGVKPDFVFSLGHPAAVLTHQRLRGSYGYGEAYLPLLAIEPSEGWCCHYTENHCAVFTAYVMPPQPGTFLWLGENEVIAMGTNRVAVGHDSGQVRVLFTAAGAQAAVEIMAPVIRHCKGFYEALHCNLSLTNVIYANTDDDDGDGIIDYDDYYVSNEDDLLPVIPFSVPTCCACVEHNITNWTCEVEGMSDNMRLYATTNKSSVIRPFFPQIGNGQTVYVEGAISSVDHAADWIDWKYYGLTKTTNGELVETNFTVRTVWTVIDVNNAPVRLEPVTVATNSAGTIVNPAGVPLNGVAVYRVEVVPEGIIPESDIHWSKNNNNVTFYGGKNWGREAYVRGQAEGDFTLEVTIDNMPTDYRPHIHGRVLTPTITPIHVYIICDADGTPAVGTDTVNAWVAEANRIYRQAAMSFTVASVDHVVSNDWFRIDNNYEFDELCSYANDTGGLELYCVSYIRGAYGKHSDMNLKYGDKRRGLAVGANANINTLAHEIGHACGLLDIRYAHDGDAVSEDLSGMSNWSGGGGTGYHPPCLKHDELVRRLVMFYIGDEQKADIAVGCVKGTDPALPDSYPTYVGLDDMSTRAPLH
ncbi:MAG: hypothetical protein GX230_00270, partial [Lentisphaerae bacterium]|nr:hypothetical protein [Lentisphaerota bacterium]